MEEHFEMEKKETVRTILAARKKARIIGGLLWSFMILGGILGAVFWKWYALVIVTVIGLLFTSIYALLQAKQISRQTGLTLEEQEKLIKKHE